MTIVYHKEMVQKRHPPIPLARIERRLRVNLSSGKCFWKDATKHHRNLVGKEAGYPRLGRGGKYYWVIKIGGIQYLRSQIIYTVKTGAWPVSCLDHKNGNSLDDRAKNIRAATHLQNARNRKSGYRGKVLPMGVRLINGKFQARIRVNGKLLDLGYFKSAWAASLFYRTARKEHFGEFS